MILLCTLRRYKIFPFNTKILLIWVSETVTVQKLQKEAWKRDPRLLVHHKVFCCCWIVFIPDQILPLLISLVLLVTPTPQIHLRWAQNNDFMFCYKIGLKRPMCVTICDESEARANSARTGILGHWQLGSCQGESELDRIETWVIGYAIKLCDLVRLRKWHV